MRTIELNSWKEFEKTLEFPSDVEKLPKTVSTLQPSTIFFRGQANAEWKLNTTLQRLGDEIPDDFAFSEYLRKAISTCGAVDSYTHSNWNLDNGDISGLDTGDIFAKLIGGGPKTRPYKTRKKIMEYLIFLRHCGFPSPLLDWSKSPYVAAFFAFAEIPKGAERVAIFQYQEMPRCLKFAPEGNEPEIRTIEYDFKTHQRHYLQQTKYTMCVKYYEKPQDTSTQGFGKYEEAFAASEQSSCYDDGNHSQDLLIQYTIPSSERKKVLWQLDKMNITYVSLFETEDALIRTLALREMDLRKD